MTAMIEIGQVTKRFGRVAAVDGVSLEIPAGESLALWGTNGAGKSTLIRCVLGLHRFSGRIAVGGHDVLRDGKRARLAIGYVPQELGFHDELGVREAFAFFARLKGLRCVDASKAIDRVGLLGHEHKRIRELSGGMKQRLALAFALLGDPAVLILDEVTASLDAVGREEFVRVLERLSGEGRTLLFASHRIEEVGTLAKRVAMLKAGRLERVLSRDEFVAEVGQGAVLRLMLDSTLRERAMRSLSESGFMPCLNGVGVLVPVDREQKAAPFRVLAEARIPIEDFEVISHARAVRLAHDAGTLEERS